MPVIATEKPVEAALVPTEGDTPVGAIMEVELMLAEAMEVDPELGADGSCEPSLVVVQSIISRRIGRIVAVQVAQELEPLLSGDTTLELSLGGLQAVGWSSLETMVAASLKSACQPEEP